MPFHLPRFDSLQASLLASYPARPRRKRTADLASRSDVIPNTDHPTPNALKPTNPFDLLPIELQVEIFDCSLPPFPSLSHNEHEALVVLTRVCRTWRSLIMSTPRFWASFQLSLGTSSKSTTPSLGFTPTLHAMEAWLTRSRQYPLSIRLEIERPRGVATSHAAQQAVGLGGAGNGPTRNEVLDQHQYFAATIVGRLLMESKRWRRVEFVLPASSMPSLLPSTFPDGLPALRSFTLHLKGLWRADHSSGTTPNSAGVVPVPVPVGCFTDLSSMGLPWHRLSELGLSMASDRLLSLDECANILSQAVNLTRCTLNVEPTMRHSDSPPTSSTGSMLSSNRLDRVFSEPGLGSVHLPHLESLELVVQPASGANLTASPSIIGGGVSSSVFSNTPEAHFVRFLHGLSTPRLKALSIRWLVPRTLMDANNANNATPTTPTASSNTVQDTNDPWSSVHPQFVSYLRDVANTNSTLESLTLAYIPFRADSQLVETLSALPTLQHVDLRYSLADSSTDPITSRFFSALSQTTTTPRATFAVGSTPSSPSSSYAINNRSHSPLTTTTVPSITPTTPTSLPTHTTSHGHFLSSSLFSPSSLNSLHIHIPIPIPVPTEKGAYTLLWSSHHPFGRSPSPLPSPSLSLSPTTATALGTNTNLANTPSLITFSHLPKLRSLRLQCSGERYDSSDLVGFVQSRWNPPTVANNNGSPASSPRMSMGGAFGHIMVPGTGALQPSVGSPFSSFRVLSMEPVSDACARRAESWRREGMDIFLDTLVV